MGETTPRFALPLLAAGQAQKEIVHNEAVTALEALVQPVAEAAGLNTPPADPRPGQSWIVGGAPTDAWSGLAGAFATWTGGGWRFVAPVEGMGAWVTASGLPARRSGGAWVVGELRATALTVGGRQVVGAQQPAIAAPVGGGAVDAEARATLSAVLATLRSHGLIAT